MANPIQLKRSTTAGNVPPSLAMGELAVNIPDRLGFIADGQGTIRPFNLTSDAEKVASGPIANALGAKIGTTGNASGATVVPQASASGGSLASLLAGSSPINALRIATGPSVYQGGLVSNPRQTYTSLCLQVNSAQPITREFAAVFGFDATHGSAVTNEDDIKAGDADKGAIFGGYYGRQGTINGWGANITSTVAPNNTTWRGLWGIEIDLENQAAHTGDALGYDGLNSLPIARGLDITCVGLPNTTFRSTAAITIGTQNLPRFNRGIAINGTVQEDIGSYSNAARFLRDWGSHGIGIDLASATYAEAAILFKAGHTLAARDLDGNIAPMMFFREDGYIVIGGGVVQGTAFQNRVFAQAGLSISDGTASVYPVQIGPPNSGPGGTGRALYV